MNYVISLASAIERRKHIQREFIKNEVDFKFFDAIPPSNYLNQLIQKFFPSMEKSEKLTLGEKSCFMSHILLWHKCIDDDLSYIAIFEDDVFLGKNAKEILGSLEWINSRFNLSSKFIIRLETFLMPVETELNEEIREIENRRFSILKSPHYGTAGYIISYEMAKYLVEFIYYLESKNIDAIDQIIFNKMLDNPELSIYQLTPAICVQELQLNKQDSTLTSQLEYKRLEKWNSPPPRSEKIKKTIWQKIVREIHRFKRKKKLAKEERENQKKRKVIEFI